MEDNINFILYDPTNIVHANANKETNVLTIILINSFHISVIITKEENIISFCFQYCFTFYRFKRLNNNPLSHINSFIYNIINHSSI